MLRFWIEKIVYGLLVLCVGGVGSLTYFDAFLPDHAHPYHLTILEGPNHTHNPLPIPAETSTQLLQQRLVGQLTTHPILTASQNAVPGPTHFSGSAFSNGFLITESPVFLCNCPSLSNRVWIGDLAKNSALLIPPDKPPTA